MQSDTLTAVDHCDDHELDDLEDQFVGAFHRIPDGRDVQRLRRGRVSLALRLPLRTRRTIAALIVSV